MGKGRKGRAAAGLSADWLVAAYSIANVARRSHRGVTASKARSGGRTVVDRRQLAETVLLGADIVLKSQLRAREESRRWKRLSEWRERSAVTAADIRCARGRSGEMQ